MRQFDRRQVVQFKQRRNGAAWPAARLCCPFHKRAAFVDIESELPASARTIAKMAKIYAELTPKSFDIVVGPCDPADMAKFGWLIP